MLNHCWEEAIGNRPWASLHILAECNKNARPWPLLPRPSPSVVYAARNFHKVMCLPRQRPRLLTVKVVHSLSSVFLSCDTLPMSVEQPPEPLYVTSMGLGIGGTERNMLIFMLLAVLRVVYSFLSDPRIFCLLAAFRLIC